jgi:dTDP-4-amino-4,6-dideoxygalactose transaminase
MISEFEKEIAKIWASSSLASPTHCGLHIAAGLGPGSIIYAVPNTFIATAVSIVQTGADLCVVDVEPDTSLSATYKDRQAGTLGLAAAFSFYPRKNLDASAARAAP